MQDGRILNHQITASSDGWWLDFHFFRAKDARLRLRSLSWVSGILDSNPWLQVSFAPEIKLISGIATQGNPSHDWWTTSYTLQHSMTGKAWQEYEQHGFAEVSEIWTGASCGRHGVLTVSTLDPGFEPWLWSPRGCCWNWEPLNFCREAWSPVDSLLGALTFFPFGALEPCFWCPGALATWSPGALSFRG